MDIGSRNIGRQRNRRSRPVPPTEIVESKDGKESPREQSEIGERS